MKQFWPVRLTGKPTVGFWVRFLCLQEETHRKKLSLSLLDVVKSVPDAWNSWGRLIMVGKRMASRKDRKT